MAYQSGEFSAAGLNQLGAPPGVGTYGDSLIVIGGTNPTMIQTTFSLSSLSSGPPTNGEPIDTEALTNTANWTSTSMKLTDTTAFTYSRCAAITMPDALYGFWHHFNGGDFGGMAGSSSDLRAGKFSGTWGSSIKLLESDGKTAPVPLFQQSGFPSFDLQAYADVSATAFGDNLIIFACAQATSANNSTGGIYLAIYDITKIDPDKNTWTADWNVYLPVDQMNLVNGRITEPFINGGNSGTNISIDWFSLAPSNNGDLAYFLAISCEPQNTGFPDAGAVLYLPLNVSANGSGGVNLSLNINDTTATTLYIMENTNVSPNSFVANPIVRDPAGRLRVYDLASSWAGYLMTTLDPTINIHEPLPWSPEIDKFTIQSLNCAPGSLFYVFPKALPATFNNLPATDYAVYEFVFYNQCQVNRYGTIQMIPNYSTMIPVQNKDGDPPPPVDDTVNIIAGIIDGPIPLPIANYVGVDLGSTQTDQGDVMYGTNTTTTTSRQLTNNWTVGVETSGEVTEGVGAAWNLSANFGMGSVLGNSETSSTSYSLSAPAIVNFDVTPPTLSPFGTLRAVSAQINATAFRFFDPNGNPISDATTNDPGQASKMATMVTTFFQPNQLSYVPYAVTPGDLTSYTPVAWNKRMQALGYPGENYYGDVICANAYPFGNPHQPYISCSWSEGSTGSTAVSRFTSSYTEQSWTLDASIFAGISGGGGFSIFGLGEEAQVSLLAGSTVTHESTTDENTESGWSVSLSETWGPTLPSKNPDPNAVTKYDFRIFFLPVPTAPSTLPPNYWTQELIKYMPNGSYPSSKNIDPNSCCWKIVFVVTAIEYVAGSTLQPYQYDFGSDEPSVYPAVDPPPTNT
ncbi:MAG TPA: hypothetical protein VFT48_18825 [Pyrinomonadaceae bacterium]|nr:hypothetical protein [Pyrinomonadaceae bacterium]